MCANISEGVENLQKFIYPWKANIIYVPNYLPMKKDFSMEEFSLKSIIGQILGKSTEKYGKCLK